MKILIMLSILFVMLSMSGCASKEARINESMPQETMSGNVVISGGEMPPDSAKPKAKTYTEMGTHDDLKGDRLKCRMDLQEIDDYVKNYADPIWQSIDANLDSYIRLEMRYSTNWSNSWGDVKRSYRRGSNGKDLERDYYYDPETGILVYAHLHAREEDYKIYFDRGQIVRFVIGEKRYIDAPNDDRIFDLANFVIWEAY